MKREMVLVSRFPPITASCLIFSLSSNSALALGARVSGIINLISSQNQHRHHRQLSSSFELPQSHGWEFSRKLLQQTKKGVFLCGILRVAAGSHDLHPHPGSQTLHRDGHQRDPLPHTHTHTHTHSVNNYLPFQTDQ